MSQERKAPADLAALRINREPARSSGPRGWIFLLAVVVVGAGAAAYFLGGRSLRPKAVETVTASIVTEGQATTVLTATGYVEAERKADLSPKITSRITQLNVTEGSRVKAGRDHRAARRHGSDRAAGRGRRELDQREGRAGAPGVALSSRACPPSRRSTPRSLPSAPRARASTYTRALIDYTVIRAPFAGVITAKRAFVGEAVSPFGSSPSGGGSGGAIVTLVEFSSLYVGADVNEANLAKLAPKQPAEITLDAVPERTYHGYLRQVVPAADRQKATVRVKVAFLDADDKILPDLSARVAFTTEATRGNANRSHVLIPRAALVTRDGQSGVWRVVDGRAKFQAIEAGGDVQGQIEVKKGLQGGERLIAVAAGSSVHEGDRIRGEGEKE